MFLSGFTVVTLLLLLALNNNKVDQLKSRLQMGYQATEEARRAVQAQEYAAAAASLTDALNLGRKPALELHEMNDTEGDKALTWLVEVCCESAELNLEHLNNANQARSDAWAACLFSQYTQCKPLLLMKAVCAKQDDLLGELQACKQLLNLSNEELSQEEGTERQAIANRLAEIEKQLAPKLKH